MENFIFITEGKSAIDFNILLFKRMCHLILKLTRVKIDYKITNQKSYLKS